MKFRKSFWNKRKVRINNHVVELKGPLSEYVLTKSGVVVLVDYEDSTKLTRNVFMIDEGGRIKWQIEELGGSRPGTPPTPYTGLFEQADGSVRTYNARGFNCALNLEDGSLFDCQFVK